MCDALLNLVTKELKEVWSDDAITERVDALERDLTTSLHSHNGPDEDEFDVMRSSVGNHADEPDESGDFVSDTDVTVSDP